MVNYVMESYCRERHAVAVKSYVKVYTSAGGGLCSGTILINAAGRCIREICMVI